VVPHASAATSGIQSTRPRAQAKRCIELLMR
jgi:hypothetical protein